MFDIDPEGDFMKLLIFFLKTFLQNSEASLLELQTSKLDKGKLILRILPDFKNQLFCFPLFFYFLSSRP